MGHRVGLEAAERERERERDRQTDRMLGIEPRIPRSHNLLAEADRFPESDMQLSRTTRCHIKFLRVVWVTVNSALFRRRSTSKQRTW
jgi:hypothetical protein